MERLVRRKVVLVLFAAGLFAKSAMGLLETRDAVSFATSPARVAGQVTTDLVWLAMALAGLACLAGACLAAAGALRFMRDQHRYRALRYLMLPPLAALVALVSGWGLGRLAQGHLGLGLGRGLFVGWNVLVSAVRPALRLCRLASPGRRRAARASLAAARPAGRLRHRQPRGRSGGAGRLPSRACRSRQQSALGPRRLVRHELASHPARDSGRRAGSRRDGDRGFTPEGGRLQSVAVVRGVSTEKRHYMRATALRHRHKVTLAPTGRWSRARVP